jgi:hypothetical protein
MPAGDGRVPHIPAWLRWAVLVAGLAVIVGFLVVSSRESNTLCNLACRMATPGEQPPEEGLVLSKDGMCWVTPECR